MTTGKTGEMTKFPKKELYRPRSAKLDKSDWTVLVAQYQTSHPWRSIWQACNTLIPFFLLWYLSYLSLSYSYWLTPVLILLTTGFLLRIFIIQHDCGHGSFFKSRKWNDYLGSFCGVLTLTPYFYWR